MSETGSGVRGETMDGGRTIWDEKKTDTGGRGMSKSGEGKKDVGAESRGAGSGVESVAGRSAAEGTAVSLSAPIRETAPPESVRFFQVDKAWLSAMAAGVAGIGENCRRQSGITQDLLKAWSQQIKQEERYGILLRTHMLKLWQNMAVSVCDEAGEEAAPLRMERLSEDILLILCNVPLASLKLREPSEGIRMRFQEDGTMHPRNPKTMETGRETLTPGEGWNWFRDAERRILNVVGERGLADMLTEYFGKEDLLKGRLTPAGFALQFIEGTRSVTLKL